MGFNVINGINICNLVTINGISRNATDQFIGQTQGISCTHQPILSDNPLPTKAAACLGVLDREPAGGVKYSNVPPGSLTIKSVITTTTGACIAATELPVGWYVIFGPNGPGENGYQIAQFTGNSNCYPEVVTDCS